VEDLTPPSPRFARLSGGTTTAPVGRREVEPPPADRRRTRRRDRDLDRFCRARPPGRAHPLLDPAVRVLGCQLGGGGVLPAEQAPPLPWRLAVPPPSGLAFGPGGGGCGAPDGARDEDRRGRPARAVSRGEGAVRRGRFCRVDVPSAASVGFHAPSCPR